MFKIISSTHNDHVKKLVQLQEKSRDRKKQGCFVIEGLREIKLAQRAGYAFAEIWACPEINPYLHDFLATETKTQIIEVTEEVYQKIAYRGSTEGILALAKSKKHTLTDLKLPDNPLILIAEAPEKPGNIGALLRTADAAGVDAMIIANPKTDLYNPNIIRSSVGGVFSMPIALASSQDTLDFLKGNNIHCYAAILQEAIPYTTPDYTKPSAIVVGTEADGLTEIWREHSTQNIIVPMQGQLDSMNVSVAAGILIFEARRQRGIFEF